MEKKIKNIYFPLLIAVIAVSFSSILIRLSKAPPLVIAAYRLGIASIILFPFMIYYGSNTSEKYSRKDLLKIFFISFFLSIHFASWITSLNYTSIANSVIIVNTSPIFVAILSYYILKEKINYNTIIGIIIAFIGTIIIAIGDYGINGSNILGDMYALIGAIALSIYIIGGREIRKKMNLYLYVTPVYAISSILLIIACIFLKIQLYPYSLREYLIFLLLAIIPTIFGHTIYNWILKNIEATTVAISLLGEPIGSTILAIIIFNEIPNFLTFIGGPITLIGIFIAIRKINKF
jgi:drug/metabolite transporter (DMT)-like permease